ncbi:MAG: hypothetical protein GX091_05300 [Peptococcaceae bacterium]|nr:hypothetical protein [Peptococcaceae bacterium]
MSATICDLKAWNRAIFSAIPIIGNYDILGSSPFDSEEKRCTKPENSI